MSKVKLFATTLLSAAILVVPATAQDRRAERNSDRDETTYEFEFRYDREDLRSADRRRETMDRLDARVDAYCEENMRRHRDACRDQIARDARRDLEAQRDEDRRARRSRYARDE